MSRKIIIGNMKTKMSYQDVIKYIRKIEDRIMYPAVILIPSSIYLPYFKNLHIKLGIQNIYTENKGAYTGEILPSQAVSMGVKYALVGHSERRSYLGENNSFINKKIKCAKEANMGVILCVGEDLNEKSMQETQNVLRRQLYTALKDIDKPSFVIIAYEPIWAIGTGLIPTKEELTKTVLFIKNYIKELKNINIKVLYGGSVSEENIEELNQIKEIDGFLIGGASCNAEEFLSIIEKVK